MYKNMQKNEHTSYLLQNVCIYIGVGYTILYLLWNALKQFFFFATHRNILHVQQRMCVRVCSDAAYPPPPGITTQNPRTPHPHNNFYSKLIKCN
jgi:hypothetical protein